MAGDYFEERTDLQQGHSITRAFTTYRFYAYLVFEFVLHHKLNAFLVISIISNFKDVQCL